MKFKVSLSIGYSTATIEDELEINDEKIKHLSESEIEQMMWDEWAEWSNNFIEGMVEKIENE